MKKIDTYLQTVGDMALRMRAKKIIEELDIRPGDKILDAGCGPGFYIRLLSFLYKDIKIIGIDTDIEALSQLRKDNKKKNIRVLYGDLMKPLPFPSNTFDKIIFSEVAEHVPSDTKALKELYRVLKKNGLLVLTVPNHNYPLFWDPVNWVLEKTTGKHISSGFWAGIWTNHIRLYTPEQIEKVVNKAGFTIEKTFSMTWWSLPFNHNLLYGGKLPKQMGEKVVAYLQKPSGVTQFLFQAIRLNDSINWIFPSKQIGVGVLVKAKKV